MGGLGRWLRGCVSRMAWPAPLASGNGWVGALAEGLGEQDGVACTHGRGWVGLRGLRLGQQCMALNLNMGRCARPGYRGGH